MGLSGKISSFFIFSCFSGEFSCDFSGEVLLIFGTAPGKSAATLMLRLCLIFPLFVSSSFFDLTTFLLENRSSSLSSENKWVVLGLSAFVFLSSENTSEDLKKYEISLIISRHTFF